MDGKQYIDSFELGPDTEELLQQQELFLPDNLRILYKLGELALLGDDLKPHVAVMAQTTLNMESTIRRTGFATALTQQRFAGAIPDKISLRRPEDNSDQLSSEELIDITVASSDKLKQEIELCSNRALSFGIKNVDHLARANKLKDGSVAKVVRDSIGISRPQLHERIGAMRGVITVSRLYDSSKNETSLDVSVRRPGTHYAPKWLKNMDSWSEELHYLCSTITETEAMLALHEWVIDNKLPYLPIMAPPEFETGKMKREAHADGNLRADILLCSLTPDVNEIIPVQIKNHVWPEDREKYHKEVALLGADEIYPVDSEPAMVRNQQGWMSTGHNSESKYGQFLEIYHANRCRPKGNRPGKELRAAFEDVKAFAYKNIDAEIRPKLRNQ
jgi:hypothetical protein